MKRELYIERIRIIAIILVIFNHTEGIAEFTNAETILMRILYLIPALLCKIAVPLFFMISGFLLLQRDLTIPQVLSRVVKKAIELVLITALFVVYKNIRWGSNYTFEDFFVFLYTGKNLSAHLWFMYQYLAFLLCVPILRGIARTIDDEKINYLILLVFVIKLVESFQYFFIPEGIAISGNIIPRWLLEDVFVYPLLGYYFGVHRIDLSEKKTARDKCSWSCCAYA